MRMFYTWLAQEMTDTIHIDNRKQAIADIKNKAKRLRCQGHRVKVKRLSAERYTKQSTESKDTDSSRIITGGQKNCESSVIT